MKMKKMLSKIDWYAVILVVECMVAIVLLYAVGSMVVRHHKIMIYIMSNFIK